MYPINADRYSVIYFTYVTQLQPGHADLETLTEVICSVIDDTSRVLVQPNNVVVLNMTKQEHWQVTMAGDVDFTNNGNMLSMAIDNTGHCTSI